MTDTELRASERRIEAAAAAGDIKRLELEARTLLAGHRERQGVRGKLTPSEKRAIKARYAEDKKMSTRKLAAEFGLSQSGVYYTLFPRAAKRGRRELAESDNKVFSDR